MGRSRFLVFGAIASLGLAACGGGGNSGGGSSTAKPDKVQIAAEGPFTGDEASIGAGALKAIQLAVKDFNNKGGVHGTPVTLLTWDDQHSAQTAQTLQAQGISDPDRPRHRRPHELRRGARLDAGPAGGEPAPALYQRISFQHQGDGLR